MLHPRQAFLSFTLLAGLAPVAMAAQGGEFDTSFQVGSGFNNGPHCVAVDAQGRVLVGGPFTSFNGFPRNRIARLFPDGSLDASFNPFAGPNDTVLDIEVQSDGKIMIAGNFTAYRSVQRPGIARLMPDGALDSTFQTAIVPAAPPVFALERQTDGKYVFGGVFDMFGGAVHRYLARVDSVGAVDGTYNAGANDFVYCLALQTDGKVLAGGRFTQLLGLPQQYIGRFESTGAVDTSFVGQADDEINSICVQTDGKALVGGFFTSYGGAPARHLARLLPDGQLDSPFQSNPGANGPVWSVATDAFGRVLVGGSFTQLAGAPRRALARLQSDGTLDTTFAPIFGPNGTVLDIAQQSNGRILIVGLFGAYDAVPSRGICRVIADGPCYVDADGDGYGTGPAVGGNGPCGAGYAGVAGDCNDANPIIYPGAPEICDGRDNDCDGAIDDGLIAIWYPDADLDGFGDSQQVHSTCNPPAGHVAVGGDCNDSNPSIFPGAPDVCDGVDNDCDGLIDGGQIESYCTPGVSYAGCVATMSSVGAPSSSNPSGFQLLASNAPGQRLGLFYYGFQPGYVAVSIDSTSYFCVLPPYQRMSTVMSSGTLGQCDGVLSIDFNQWLQANPTALGNPMVPGTVIYAQAWYRDPRVRDRANLSDGLKFTLCN